MNKIQLLTISLILIISTAFMGQTKNPTGKVRGKVTDNDTKMPLIGTNVIVTGTQWGAATDTDGNFEIDNLPVGNYTLRFVYLGYEEQVKADIIIRPERTTFVNAGMRLASIESEEVTVTGGYYSDTEEQANSVVNFSYEEIRRAPGSAGDVSRIMMSLPSVAKVDDQRNALVVRGGSPNENAFFIDNIEIPNINHFPSQGSSGGPIGLLNVDFISDVNFYSGGFSSAYGDKLSSVMDISLREGNREEFDGQLDLNFSGFGGVFEGPLGGGKGSWLFSARRSYLDFLIKMVDAGSSIAPVYGDVQTKIVYNLDKYNKLSFIGIFGDDHSESDLENAIENDIKEYGTQDYLEGTAGINWQRIWGNSGFSNTSVAYTLGSFKEDFYNRLSGNLVYKNNSQESELKLRNSNRFRINKANSFEFGIEGKLLFTDYDNFYAASVDPLGQPVPAMNLIIAEMAQKGGAFLNYMWKPIPSLSINPGVRADYFSWNENFYVSPRLSLEWGMTQKATLSASAGYFVQSLPMNLLMQDEKFKELKDPSALHYIVGFSYLLSEDTKLTLEAYKKDYDNFPRDPEQPSLFIMDEIYYRNMFISGHENLADNGKATSWGVEFTLQKKLAVDFYGLVSGSYFRSQYETADGETKNRVFDNRFVFSAEGGYKPGNKWEFSMRWIFAGGSPYTLFDITASTTANQGIFNQDRINGERYPHYHSLNLRVDRRFNFASSSMVVYISVWNAYGRKNITSYYWNENENRQDTIYQWGLLPIFGIEYEF